jgi:glyoxylase-like metal-dependent hydrolase (beta-lactamase superfamily II)
MQSEIFTLEIEFSVGNIKDYIYPAVIKEQDCMMLVDCGFTGYLPSIEKAMEDVNIACNNLTHVFITHHDHDHMGALSDLLKKYPSIKTVTSEAEKPYVNGEKTSLRLMQAMGMQESLSGEQKAFGEKFCEILRKVKPVKVDITVKDNQILKFMKSCRVLSTCGHTPGHMSLYIEEHKTVITGDAAVIKNGKLEIANPDFAMDKENAYKSLQKLVDLKAERLICYHGGTFT